MNPFMYKSQYSSTYKYSNPLNRQALKASQTIICPGGVQPRLCHPTSFPNLDYPSLLLNSLPPSPSFPHFPSDCLSLPPPQLG